MGLQTGIPARDTGYQNIQYIRGDITFASSGAVVIGKIPAGSIILKATSGLFITTAFNAGTNNNIDVGTSADEDLFGTDLSGATAGFVALDEAIGGYVVADDTTITATVQTSGTAATAGAATVLIAYAPNN